MQIYFQLLLLLGREEELPEMSLPSLVQGVFKKAKLLIFFVQLITKKKYCKEKIPFSRREKPDVHTKELP